MSDDNNIPNLNEKSRVVSNSPGDILQQARNKTGLSTIEVSEKLFLSESIIINLERDNYERIINHAFVRGYLRSYAKLLKVDGDLIIDTFNALGIEDSYAPIQIAESDALPGNTLCHKLPISENLIRKMGYGAVAAIIVLTGIWWFSQDTSNVPKGKHSLSATDAANDNRAAKLEKNLLLPGSKEKNASKKNQEPVSATISTDDAVKAKKTEKKRTKKTSMDLMPKLQFDPTEQQVS